MKRPGRSRVAAALIAGALSGCALGPDYRAPEPAPADFRHAGEAAFVREPLQAAWWRQLGDPVLDELIAGALADGLDLRIAEARVRESRALFRESRLDYAPAVTTRAAYEKRDAQLPGFGADERIATETYELGFDAAWELDLFGRVRLGVQAARADAETAEALLRDAEVRLAAEVAREYFELRGAQRRLAVAEDNLDNQREAMRLTQVRYDLGAGYELDVASARARLKETEASIPPLHKAERAAAHRLAVLAGQRPGSFDVRLAPVPAKPRVRPLAIGTPEELLRRRPDVRAAERALAAQIARVGVATADLFPRLSLSGFFGFIAGDAAALGESNTRAWSVAPTLSWAALDLGSVQAQLRAAEARADAQLAAYEQTVLLALEETDNAFVAFAQDQQRLAALVAQAAASKRATELARVQYREGALDFLRLLDAQRTVLQAEDAVAQAETALNTDVVAIYKALGGG
ncbi:MAG TPA: efflux transporter outer membrane subunit [Gammaproteobacteria bacterium]|nr:efflux transporter outer membrane subunit [Gammaproteobacteria bacterium]